METFDREEALRLFLAHNHEPFHLRHALTLEAVMRWFARRDGEDETFWGLVGLLHDIDFGEWPEEHCQHAEALLRGIGASDAFVHAVLSHAYGLCSGVEPTLPMEKTLFAVDELTGLIGAAALMRPSRSTTDMELSSVKKKFKDKRFAAGCSRDVIREGAERMGVPLDTLMADTLAAMSATEAEVEAEYARLTAAQG